jgi:hypothetical protein
VVVAVKSANVESVDNPWELCALAKGSVNTNAVREVPLGWRIECDGLTVAEPQGEVRNRRLLLLEPRRKIPMARDDCVCLVDKVTRQWA